MGKDEPEEKYSIDKMSSATDDYLCHELFYLKMAFKKQASFNFMAAVTICSDFRAPKIKSLTVSIVSSSICYEVM